jgi:3-deoxy-D-manno-octulosonate 8-phosphate phosphatase (KDO 8-P phosphatase)
MPYSHLNDFPADVRERAARVRLVAFDVDGTLTDGKLGLDGNGLETKQFHVHDGLGLKLLLDAGIEVALVTARTGTVVNGRAKELGVQHVFLGVANKLACIDALIARLGLTREQTAYMGDDLPDLGALSALGLAVAPANAHPWVRERVHWRTQAAGGNGAARELCDLILAACGEADSVLHRYLPE